MLEYLAFKKYKAHQAKKEATKAQDSTAHIDSIEDDQIISEGSNVTSASKGKCTVEESDAISTSDEIFLERNLASVSSLDAPVTLRQRIASVAQQWHGLGIRGQNTTLRTDTTRTPMDAKEEYTSSSSTASHDAIVETSETTVVEPAIGPSSTALAGRSRPVDVDDESAMLDNPLADEESQRTQLQKLLDAFNMSLSSSGAGATFSAGHSAKTISERMSETLRVSTINDKTRELMSEFVQILKDIQNGAPLAGQDLVSFFDKHAGDLKAASESVPSFIKSLVLKLLPFSAIPSIEELSKPGALMALIKGVLQVLKTRFPAFVGGSVLTVMAVVVVMLGLFYAFKRGREEREALETSPFSQVSAPAVSGLDRGRQVEISVDGVHYVTVLDEDGMRIPCPEDERGVYWDATKKSYVRALEGST